MLENGAVAESGTFVELSSRENGKFRALIQKQLLDDDSERSAKVSL
jgi:ABC-type multidrug transport system fused ATPase/permease subunit